MHMDWHSGRSCPRKWESAAASLGNPWVPAWAGSSGSNQLLSSTARAVALVLLATTALVGCSDIYYDRRETISFGADDAVVSNRVIHMVDPWPRYVGDRNIAFNGERMQAAVERYRRHEVILPRPYSTNSMSQQNMTTYTEGVPVAAPAAPSTPAAPVK